MKDIFTLNLNHMYKKFLFSAIMLALVVIAVASSGGGKKKSAHSSLGIIPLKAANGLLADETRAGYTGTHLVQREKEDQTLVLRSVSSFRKGNTTYLVPSKIKLSTGNLAAANASNGRLRLGELSCKDMESNGLKARSRSNLNVVDLKVRLGK